MGKRAREKKMLKVEQQVEEKTLIEERKKSRVEPTARYLKKFVLTLVATALLLWVGVFVAQQINNILLKLGMSS